MKLLKTLFCWSDLITVVDERTYRAAVRTVTDLMASGDPHDLTRANSGLHSMRRWLRYELHTGPKRRRIKMAARLEQAELWQAQVHEALGIAGIPGVGRL
jgi:hypothetical protein